LNTSNSVLLPFTFDPLGGWLLATARPTNTVTVIFGSSPDNSQHPQTLTFASNTTQTAYNNQVSKSAPTAILLLMSVLKSPGKITGLSSHPLCCNIPWVDPKYLGLADPLCQDEVCPITPLIHMTIH
jgi:hypothetical protein